MGIIKRQSLKTSIVNYIGVLLGVIFFIFLFPHILSKEYLGLIGLFQNITWMFVSIPGLGLLHIMYKYYSNWKDEETLNHFNAFAMLLMGLSSLVFITLYLLLKQPIIDFYKTKSALFVPYYWIGIPLVIIQAYSLYFEMFCSMRLRVSVPTFVREIGSRVLLIVLVYLFVYGVLNEGQFVYGLPLVYLISLIVLLAYSIKGLQFKAYKPFAYLKDNIDIKQQLAFGGSLFLLSNMFSIQNFLDGILIPAYLGLGALGIYGRPLVLGQMIHVPFRAIAQITQPILREAWVNNDIQKIKDLHKSISLNLYLIGGFLFTLLVANADNIFKLLPKEYEEGKNVLYIIAIGRLLDMAFGLNNEILYSSKYYKYIVYLAFFIVLSTVGLNILLIPRFGMIGPALAVSISLTLFNIIKTLIIQSKFHFHCFSKHYFTLSVLIIVVIGLLRLVPFVSFVPHHMFMNALSNVVFMSFVGSILFLVPLYFLHISTDFNDFVKLIISGKIFKGGHKMDAL